MLQNRTLNSHHRNVLHPDRCDGDRCDGDLDRSKLSCPAIAVQVHSCPTDDSCFVGMTDSDGQAVLCCVVLCRVLCRVLCAVW